MAGVIATIPKFQFSANGVPMVGGTLETYIAGSTTPATTWQDSALTIANTNPISLDARGECVLWLDPAVVYKFVLKNAPSNGGVVQWTQDNISTPAALANSLRSDLAAPTGASLIGGGGQVVSSIAALRSLLKTSASKNAMVTGYYAAGDGGGGSYWYDATDTTTADNGGTVIVASDGGRWKLQYVGFVSVLQFGVKADAGTTDNSTTLANCRAWVAANAVRNKLVFPAGIYGYSVSPNWAIQNAHIVADGEVRLRYSGTGNAVILDTGPTINTFTYNITMGTFIVEAPSTAGHGVYIRSIHHSKLAFKVEGAGATSDGIRVEFAVVSLFDNCTVTQNEKNGWYLNAKPVNGIHLLSRNAGETVSYCTFINPVCEGLSAAGGSGILLEGTLGNVFLGGTSEGCTYGISTGTASNQNKFFGIDLESNSTDDIYEQGRGNEYHGVDSLLHVTVAGAALFPKFFGGNYQTILIGGGAKYPVFSGISYNRASGGSITNNEPTSVFANCFDIVNQKIGPLVQGAIAVGASPFTYTNTTGNKQYVTISGGAITGFNLIRGGVSNVIPAPPGNYLLSPGDALQVTYTTVPTMYQYSE